MLLHNMLKQLTNSEGMPGYCSEGVLGDKHTLYNYTYSNHVNVCLCCLQTLRG